MRHHVNDAGTGTSPRASERDRYAVLKLEEDEALLYDCENPRAWIWTTVLFHADDCR
ncbi:hypothetical protein [Halomarina pelagica]|uniref:hypothetical protein n=1 Tax=Halomarina pelagica TaxID=2961599 RepID=UPI0020C53103|nr:hypothetical protein [Halomarina sp. BND7]